MPRAKRGFKARARRKKVLKRAKGFIGSNNRLFVTAQEVVDRAGVYAYRDRKTKKREFRKLWTQRINAAARLNGTTYSKLIGALNKSGMMIDRKILADLAVNDKTGFTAVIQKLGLAKQA
jgi:large subunit ribosomal protein L20